MIKHTAGLAALAASAGNVSGVVDFTTVGYATTGGARLWARSYQPPTVVNGTDGAHAAGMSPDGASVYITGSAAGKRRAFLARAVRYLAAERGIRQFLDIGTGLPAPASTHEVAQQAAPDCAVVYADNDPLVLVYARALLTCRPPGRCGYVDADLRDTATLLEKATRTLDFSRPAAVLLLAILHFIPDSDDPAGIVATLTHA